MSELLTAMVSCLAFKVSKGTEGGGVSILQPGENGQSQTQNRLVPNKSQLDDAVWISHPTTRAFDWETVDFSQRKKKKKQTLGQVTGKQSKVKPTVWWFSMGGVVLKGGYLKRDHFPSIVWFSYAQISLLEKSEVGHNIHQAPSKQGPAEYACFGLGRTCSSTTR